MPIFPIYGINIYANEKKKGKDVHHFYKNETDSSKKIIRYRKTHEHTNVLYAILFIILFCINVS